jgi:DNA-binding NtrC family response regulator
MVEQAEGGTLFLDEIGDLSPASQVKLLRLLQEREYHPLGSDRPKKANVRVIAATNVDLAARQADGKFRRDLFYRLGSHQVHLPPLRERPDDISLLLDHFLEEASKDLGKRRPSYPHELPILLANYSFPGNLRELRGMVFNALSLHSSGTLSMASFSQAVGATEAVVPPPALEGESIVFPQRLPTIKQSVNLLVDEAMRRAKGRQSLAARMLGISRPALSKRMAKQNGFHS